MILTLVKMVQKTFSKTIAVGGERLGSPLNMVRTREDLHPRSGVRRKVWKGITQRSCQK